MQWLGKADEMLFDTRTPCKQLLVAGDAGGGGGLAALGHRRQEVGEKLCQGWLEEAVKHR